jgi:hypothetical protein
LRELSDGVSGIGTSSLISERSRERKNFHGQTLDSPA